MPFVAVVPVTVVLPFTVKLEFTLEFVAQSTEPVPPVPHCTVFGVPTATAAGKNNALVVAVMAIARSLR